MISKKPIPFWVFELNRTNQLAHTVVYCMCHRISSIKLYSFLIELNNQRISSTKLALLSNRPNHLAHVIVCAPGLVRLNCIPF